jgi:MbtH protein
VFADDDARHYDVVCNEEAQYSIWPAGRAVPAGWTKVGFTGAKADCLDYISRRWTDMRPLSLRRGAGA